MNRNLLIVLGGGLVIAVLVALMVQVSLGGKRKAQQAPAPEPRAAIIVAAAPLKVGDRLTADNMSWKEIPRSAVFPGMVVRKERQQTVTAALSGRAQRAIVAGEPILNSAVIKDGSNVMAAVLREGMRAVTLDLRPAAMVAGFAAPGDYVDIILTYRGRMRYSGGSEEVRNMVAANLNSYAAQTIMENVRVLALDSRMTAATGGSDDGKSSNRVAKTVTLEVSPEGAEVLWLARRMGDVSLSLRRLGDDEVQEGFSPATTDARITSIWHEIYATMEKMSGDNSGQTGNIVRVYTGPHINDIPVGR